MKKSICLLIMTILIAAVPVFAEEAMGPAVSGSASVDIMSNYVWRGQKLSNGGVMQPSVGITYEGFGANFWANYDNGLHEMNETDLTLNYAYSIDMVNLEAGFIFYALDGVDDTQEFYVSAGLDVIASPAITVYYDVDEGNGAFIVASVGHSFELPQKMSLDLGASASYNAKNEVMGTDADGNDFSNFYNGEFSAAVTVPVTDNISVAPKIAYSFPLSNDAEDAIEAISDDGDSDIVYGGINVTLSF